MLSIVLPGTWKYSIFYCLETFSPNSGFLLCPRILDYSSCYSSIIQNNPKNVREWGYSLKRCDSQLCAMWHKPNYTSISLDSPTCSMCKGLTNELKAIKCCAETNLSFGYGNVERVVFQSTTEVSVSF